MKVLIVGDIIGNPGREILKAYLERKRKDYDLVIVNGENSAAGFGITGKLADQLFDWGCDVITGGNHIWDKKEFYDYLDKSDKVLRPANYPEGVPGRGYTIVKDKNGNKIGVISLQGRVFMPPIDCPFKKAKELIEEIRKETKIIIIDFHAEATSEKIAMGFYLDGKVTCVVGTHTHVQTADNRILPKGTAYISDLGMVGPYNSSLGINVNNAIDKFITCRPVRFEMAEGPNIFSAVVLELAEDNSVKSFERILFNEE